MESADKFKALLRDVEFDAAAEEAARHLSANPFAVDYLGAIVKALRESAQYTAALRVALLQVDVARKALLGIEPEGIADLVRSAILDPRDPRTTRETCARGFDDAETAALGAFREVEERLWNGIRPSVTKETAAETLRGQDLEKEPEPPASVENALLEASFFLENDLFAEAIQKLGWALSVEPTNTQAGDLLTAALRLRGDG